MEWMLSTRGRKMCIVDKYPFRRSKETSGGVSYRCTRNGCQAWLSVDKTETFLLRMIGEHNHPASKKLEVERLKNLVKKKVTENLTEQPKKIMDSSIEQEGGNLNLTKQDIANIKKSIYRKRKCILRERSGVCNFEGAKNGGEGSTASNPCSGNNTSADNSLDPCEDFKIVENDYSALDVAAEYPEDSTNITNNMVVDEATTTADASTNKADDCQRRWCVIRNRYAKEKRLANDVNNMHLRNAWPCMPALGFLANVVKPRRSFGMSSNSFFSEDSSTSQSEKKDTAANYNEDVQAGCEERWIKTENPDIAEIEESGCGSSVSMSSDPSYMSVRNTPYDFIKDENNAETATSSTACFKNETVIEEPDSDYNFCLSLHKSLKEIRKKYNMKAKIEILQVIDKYQNME